MLLLAGAGTAIALKVNHDNDIEAERRAEEEADREAERQAKREQQQQQLERTTRQLIVTELETSVTKDAQETAASGLLDGPIVRTECEPSGGVVDLAAITQEVSCFAISEENADGTASGYDYDATVNYSKFTYTWQLAP